MIVFSLNLTERRGVQLRYRLLRQVLDLCTLLGGQIKQAVETLVERTLSEPRFRVLCAVGEIAIACEQGNLLHVSPSEKHV